MTPNKNAYQERTADNITRKVLNQESVNKINGLATECRTLCLSLGLPILMAREVTKNVVFIRMNLSI